MALRVAFYWSQIQVTKILTKIVEHFIDLNTNPWSVLLWKHLVQDVSPKVSHTKRWLLYKKCIFLKAKKYSFNKKVVLIVVAKL